MISAIQMSIIAVIGDLLSINRKLMEDVQTRIKNWSLDNKKPLEKSGAEKGKRELSKSSNYILELLTHI